MVMSGWSVHLTTLFLGQAWTSTSCNTFADNNPSWISRREENDSRNYFMVKLHETIGPGRDRTPDPWICSKTCICSQTCYRLCYVAGVTPSMCRLCFPGDTKSMGINIQHGKGNNKHASVYSQTLMTRIDRDSRNDFELSLVCMILNQ